MPFGSNKGAGSECLPNSLGRGFLVGRDCDLAGGDGEGGRRIVAWVGLCQHDVEGFLVGGVRHDENWHGL